MKPLSLLSFPLAATLAFVCAPPSAGAAVVITNLTGGTQSFSSDISGPTAQVFSFPIPNRQTAFSFTSGPTLSTFVSLDALVTPGDNSSPLTATLSTGSSVPGGTNPINIGSFQASTFVAQVASFSAAPATTITLQPNTEYWVHLTVPSGGGIYSIQNADNATTASGWALNPTYQRADTAPWTPLSGNLRARVELTVDQIPEPGSTLLTIIALSAIALRRRR